MKQGTDTKEVSDAALRQGLRKEQWEQAEEYNNDGDSSEEDGESGDLIHLQQHFPQGDALDDDSSTAESENDDADEVQRKLPRGECRTLGEAGWSHVKN